MSSASTLEQLEARAHRTLAEASLAREILRHPRSPRAVERAWRLVTSLRTLLAFAEPERLEPLGPNGLWFVTELFQLTHNKLRNLVDLAAKQGLAKQPWFRAWTEGLEALGDALEGLYLSRDPECRAIVNEAIKELDSSRPSQVEIPDWRSSLAKMPD